MPSEPRDDQPAPQQSKSPHLDTPKSATPSKVAVVVVNYGTADLAASAVRSALEQDVDCTVHLVDNASPGEDARRLAQRIKDDGWGPRVVFYPDTENHGFGRGNNIALTALMAQPAPPDYVLLLNPDATLTAGALGQMQAFLDATPEAGCVGAQISKPDTGPVTAAFRFPDAVVEFVSAANLGVLTRLSGGRTLWHDPLIATGRVDWVAGAAVMFRTAALRDSGLFDPDFFLYFEEVELMWRLDRAGWPCWYLAEAHVVHAEGAATQVQGRARDRKPAYWYASQRMYYLKTSPRGRAGVRALARAAGAVVNLAVSRLRGREADQPVNYLSDFSRLVLKPIVFKTTPDDRHV